MKYTSFFTILLLGCTSMKTLNRNSITVDDYKVKNINLEYLIDSLNTSVFTKKEIESIEVIYDKKVQRSSIPKRGVLEIRVSLVKDDNIGLYQVENHPRNDKEGGGWFYILKTEDGVLGCVWNDKHEKKSDQDFVALYKFLEKHQDMFTDEELKQIEKKYKYPLQHDIGRPTDF